MKRRLLQTLITVTVMSSLIVTPVLATPQKDVEELEQKKNQAEAQANQVNEELVNLLVDYDALQVDMANQEKRIDQAEEDLKDAEKKEKQQYEDMKLRIKYMYEGGDLSAFLTLLSSKSFSDFVSKAEYIQKVHEYDRNKLDEYVEVKNEVADLKENLEEGQSEMEFLSTEMGRQKATLETTLTEMRSQIDDFDSQLTQAKAEAAEELKRIEAEQKAQEEVEQMEAATASKDTQDGKDTQQPEREDSKPAKEPSKEESKPKPSKPSDNNKEEDKKPDKKPDKEEPKEEDKKEDTPASSGNAALGQQIADMGLRYVGNKYVYGGNSLTNGIDCSGFVQQIHAKFGISTPRTSGALRSQGKSVSYANRMPGDVICYSGHVAIYIGNNKIVHASNSAPYPKGGIKVSSPANYRTVLAVRRYW